MIDPRLLDHEIDLDAKLCTMGYSIEWIRWGVLTVPKFEKQLAEYEHAVELYRSDPDADVDTNTEHWRWAQFCSWLDEQEHIDDSMLDNLLWLIRHDPDTAMSSSIYDRLLCESWFPITDTQFNLVSQIMMSYGMTNNVARQKALRLVWTTPWSEQLRNIVLADCTGKQQLEILEYLGTALSRSDVEAFHLHGASKGVQNATKQMLSSNRFKNG